MTISKNITAHIKGQLTRSENLPQIWKQLLKTHIKKYSLKMGTEDFSDSQEFKNIAVLKEDLLDNLTFNEISIIYEYALSESNHSDRKESGQYFTPEDVSKFLAEQQKLFPKNSIWLDPCAGVGNLSYWLVSQQPNPSEFILKNLKLADKDSLALLTARVFLTLHFNPTKDFFVKTSDRVFHQNFLDTVPPEHDYILVNPPYLNLSKGDTRFETKDTKDLYAYFLEVISKHSKGFISITPQSFTNSSKFKSLRKIIIEKYNTLDVYVFDNMPDTIFKGYKFGSKNTNTKNSVRAAITVARNSNKPLYRTTPILRWVSEERSKVFLQAPSMLSKFSPDEKIFPKLSEGLNNYYYELINKPKMGEIMSSKPTQWKLQIATTPRYYISATYRTLNRRSSKNLYFKDEKSLQKAYLLLNSSLMYWWWRVNDGGMTLALETIKSLPMPTFKADETLLSLLKQSETENLVFKMNAGKKNENVKHPLSLVDQINKTIAPEYAGLLLETHKNSFIH